MTVNPKSNEIQIIRIYDAPVKAVWAAWVDPQQVGLWWGPRGFTLTTKNKDVRTGGSWTYTMHGPDGVDYPNKTQFLEVVKGSKLVYDHGASDDRPAMFRVTVEFNEVSGKTTMNMIMALPSAEAAQETRKFIKSANGDSTWDRLAEFLDEKLNNKKTFVINRSFSTPLTKMYELWTDPKHFSQWLAPTGFTMEFLKADISPGGECFYFMTGDGKSKLYGRTEYLKMEKPNRIVYTQQFCDEKENISRHPMAPTWPETMLTNVTYSEEGPSKTRVTVTWEIYGKATPEEINTFVGARAGMMQGWTGSFDKLEQYLETSKG